AGQAGHAGPRHPRPDDVGACMELQYAGRLAHVVGQGGVGDLAEFRTVVLDVDRQGTAAGAAMIVGDLDADAQGQHVFDAMARGPVVGMVDLAGQGDVIGAGVVDLHGDHGNTV